MLLTVDDLLENFLHPLVDVQTVFVAQAQHVCFIRQVCKKCLNESHVLFHMRHDDDDDD